MHCEADVTREHLKRDIEVDIEWPATVVGSRRIVRCPYAYDRSSYAHRDCILSAADKFPRWSDANVSRCPDPPFSRAVDRLASFMVSSKNLSPPVILF